MEQRVMDPRRHGAGTDVFEPRYWPVIDVASGRVVGAELVVPSVEGVGASSAAWVGSVPALARIAAHGFATGPAAAEGWWVGVKLRFGQIEVPAAAVVVDALLRDSGLPPERLLLQITEAELTRSVESGSADALAALGVRLAVVDFGLGDATFGLLRAAPVAVAHVDLTGLDPADPADVTTLHSAVTSASSLGIAVLGEMVESDDQLALAGKVGIELVQGYRWGSAGSLPKLVATWARHAVSE